ncbi:glycosyltransferase [Aridibaculum aurantiacum]|uniref:glycosyltransferase n=1 Tax=Aridibaculum aurantiacum TaxID=2810307 RepID=UPI001A9745C8|nr:glycosyltransferase [Aridibaculum aurantiacum]
MAQLNGTVGVGKVTVKGKFLFRGRQKFYIKGVTYGTFAPDEEGFQFPDETVIAKDFEMMALHGINSVRTYTVPSQSILNLALQNNLQVMVGLPWEQHITFLDTKERQQDIIRRVKEGVRASAGHPAILCYAIGNEIPAPIVRWYGKEKIERFLKRLYKAVKEEAPEALVTYVNYPTTEYLDLSFLDFDCFNVYLETPEKLSKYIARLHNLAGDRPLVLAEIGLDSMRNGHDKQSEVLRWQVETIFGKGCAGMFVFAWTDEWWRGGYEIEDWDFGLVDRCRQAKPALFTVAASMLEVPVRIEHHFPSFSVVICTYNGSATIKDTLDGLQRLKYPNYEVIVVNDGSKDNTVEIVSKYEDVRLITTSNCGLSSARNTGMYNARGEILAYIDDDAYPDPHWLHYLAYAYSNSSHAAMGGPNIIPEEDGPIATCVANAPGGPVHVLETDEIAEHIPGCNLSVRKDVLMKIGGFDPMYRAAGDDVDVCWRIQEAGYTIGFHPSALVWHHRRNSIKAYWKQQKGYGKAEALLEHKWPEKYNGFGHLTWAGRIYGHGFTLPIKTKKDRVFHGTWGSALFQSVYQPADGLLNCIPLMPEYYLITGMFGLLGALGLFWPPLIWMWLFFAASIVTIVVQAAISSSKNSSLTKSQSANWKYRLLIFFFHIIQPVARLRGRINNGLTPWRVRGSGGLIHKAPLVRSRTLKHWSEAEWKGNETWLEELESNIIKCKARVKRGGDFDRWDLQVRTGLFSSARSILTVEEHGANKQYVKMKYWVRHSWIGIFLVTAFVSIDVAAALEQSWVALGLLVTITSFILLKYVQDIQRVSGCVQHSFNSLSLQGEKESKLVLVKVDGMEEAEQSEAPGVYEDSHMRNFRSNIVNGKI